MNVKLLSLVCLTLVAMLAPQQLRFDDVVRNLRNPDPKARLSAVRLLRDAKYPEAIEPMAPLVNDPIDEIQLETIAAELSFFVTADVRAKKMVGFVVEKRNPAVAAAAFDAGPAIVWPRPVPASVVSQLLKAVDDENARVRLEAIYAAGVIGRPPLAPEQIRQLIAALDHYDPAIRAAAARVIGRLGVESAGDALMKAVNDSQADVRYAAMRALGAIHDTRAVTTLTEQLAFYRKGEGAWAALDGLARLAAPASVPLFKERLADKDPYLRRAAAEGLARAGDRSALDQLQRGVTTDDSPMVRLATAFALQVLGQNYVGRIVDTMTNGKLEGQAIEYLVELGPPVAPTLYPRLQDPDPGIREAASDALGFIGGIAALPALEAAAKDSNTEAATAARRAIERIKATSAAQPPRG